MLHFVLAKLSVASIWIDYVPTESNIADIPSRWHEMSEAERASALFELGELVEMKIPTLADDQGNWLSMKSIAQSVYGRAH